MRPPYDFSNCCVLHRNSLNSHNDYPFKCLSQLISRISPPRRAGKYFHAHRCHVAMLRGSITRPCCRDAAARPCGNAAPPSVRHPSRPLAQRPRPAQHKQNPVRCFAERWNSSNSDVTPPSSLQGAAVCLVGALAVCCTAMAPGAAQAFQRTSDAPYVSAEGAQSCTLGADAVQCRSHANSSLTF